MIAYLKDVIARVTNRLTLTIWVLAGSLATLVGPFGTYSAFTIPQRATYWFLVAGVSILIAYGVRMAVARLNLKDGSAPFELSSALIFAAVFAPILSMITERFVEDAINLPPLWFFAATVVAIYLMVSFLRHVLGCADPETETIRLMARIPEHRGKEIARLTVKDHYVDIYMTDGSRARVLMRFQDAITEAEGLDGFSIHRSHWVTRGAITEVVRRKGREFVKLNCGTEVPIGRKYRENLVEAGIL